MSCSQLYICYVENFSVIKRNNKYSSVYALDEENHPPAKMRKNKNYVVSSSEEEQDDGMSNHLFHYLSLQLFFHILHKCGFFVSINAIKRGVHRNKTEEALFLPILPISSHIFCPLSLFLYNPSPLYRGK